MDTYAISTSTHVVRIRRTFSYADGIQPTTEEQLTDYRSVSMNIYSVYGDIIYRHTHGYDVLGLVRVYWYTEPIPKGRYTLSSFRLANHMSSSIIRRNNTRWVAERNVCIFTLPTYCRAVVIQPVLTFSHRAVACLGTLSLNSRIRDPNDCTVVLLRHRLLQQKYLIEKKKLKNT